MNETDTQAAPLQVRVKELIWYEWQGEIYGSAPYMMSYRIDRKGPVWSLHTIGNFDTLDAAKQAAQDDYRDRIEAALDLSTPPQIAALEAEIEKLRAALADAQEAARWNMHWRVWRAEAEVARLTEALKADWHGVFLDGRNEHGAHVIRLPQRSIEIEQDDSGDFLKSMAETILSDAESAGFKVGDAVVALFSACYDDGFFSHYEFTGLSVELTTAIYGSSHDQHLSTLKESTNAA